MFTCKTTDTQADSIKGRNVRFILMDAILFAQTAGTAINASGTLLDTTKIRLEVKVMRKGQKPEFVYNDQVRYINALSGFEKPNFEFLTPGTLDIQVANGTGVIEKGIIPLICDLGQVYVLGAGDEMHVSVNTTGFVTDSTISTSTSILEVYALGPDAYDLDNSHSEIGVYNIQASKTADTVSLGDGVTRILYLNFDKTTILDADAPISTISLDSKQKKIMNLTQNGLLAMRMNQFITKAQSDARNQSFMIHDGEALDEVRVDVTLNGSNVTASNNYIVWRKRNHTPTSLARGAAHAATKNAAVLKKAGLHQAAAQHLAGFNA